MKSGHSQKIFKRFTDFQDKPLKQRNTKYTEKVITDKNDTVKPILKPRECFKILFKTYSQSRIISQKMKEIIERFPRYFTNEGRLLPQNTNENLNEYVFFPKPKVASRGAPVHTPWIAGDESDAPDWNDDSDVDNNLESKEIDSKIKQKAAAKFADVKSKIKNQLAQHEIQFLEDYAKNRNKLSSKQVRKNSQSPKQAYVQKFNNKQAYVPPKGGQLSTNNCSIKEIQQKKESSIKPQNDCHSIVQKKLQISQVQKKHPLPQSSKKPLFQDISKGTVKQESARIIWSQYQTKQVKTMVNSGLMVEVSEPFDSLNEELCASSSSSDDDGDDVLGREETIASKEQKEDREGKESKQPTARGVVHVHTRDFSSVAEKLGINPTSCLWVISDLKQKYRVTTEYMDTVYRKEKMCDTLPYVSLNQSEFILQAELEKDYLLLSRKKMKQMYQEKKG